MLLQAMGQNGFETKSCPATELETLEQEALAARMDVSYAFVLPCVGDSYYVLSLDCTLSYLPYLGQRIINKM